MYRNRIVDNAVGIDVMDIYKAHDSDYNNAFDIDIEIKGIIESSFLDWDGKIVTVVYLPKCNYRCPFCHNWELIENPEKFKTVTYSELDRYLISNRDFIDGVCITGGEPTIYRSLPAFIEHILGLGLRVKLDTNGTNPNLIAELIDDKLIDYIAMDIKGPLDERYNKLAGVKADLNNIKKSIEVIMGSPMDYEFRTTVVPTLLDESDVKNILNDFNGAKKFVFQQFVPDHARKKKLQKVKPYSKDFFNNISKFAKKTIKNVVLRGVK